MKKLYLLTFILFSFLINAQGGNLSAYLSYSTFYSINDGPFIETYISVVGNSVVFVKKDNGKFQGTIEITIMFKNGEDIQDFKKYELYSPEIDDTTNVNFNFIDQQRFILPGGNYDLELLISDKHAEAKAFSIVQPITIFFPEEKVSISGIELVDSYTQTSEENILSKSGYDLIPYLFNYFPENLDEIIFYTEIYNTEKMLGANEKFLLSYFIESFETDKKISKLVRFRRETTKAVVVLLSKFDISELASGNYNLVIEVIDRQNKILASNTIFFQRNNPKVQFALSDITALNLNNTFAERITNADTLDEYIRMLEPISDEIESIFASTQLEKSDLNTKQQYFMNFWLNRDNINPELAWFNYYKEVKNGD